MTTQIDIFGSDQDWTMPAFLVLLMTVLAMLGIVAVGLAPLLTVRRLRRMDVPATLRVVE